MRTIGVIAGVHVLGCALSAYGDGFGSWSPPTHSDCIPAAQRIAVEEGSSYQREGVTPVVSPGPQPYRFQPIAGTVWQDRFILNFFDLDPSPGIRDWDCSQWTYDGHGATDILIRGFADQDAGVPVFAALDGVVSDAHDGEYDRNTVLGGQPANYVILDHGGAQSSWYWHLRKRSVAVSVGEVVRAGTEIGQAGSSGHSYMPHLHFESHFNYSSYETYSGRCNPGPSHWVNQTAIPRHTWVSEFAMHDSNNIPDEAFYPHNPPRTGTFVRTGIPQAIGAWYVIHNEAANSTRRARYVRPDGTTGYDPGARSKNNAYNRWAATWFSFSFAPDRSGTWTLELTVNGQVLVNAPFLVLDAGFSPTNRPPQTPTGIAFDPLTPTNEDALFCRLTAPLIADADYDLVRYRFQWFVNGVSLRVTTNGALADAIPRGAAGPNDLVRCVVTPYDGREFGQPIEAWTPAARPPVLQIRNVGRSAVVISWPTSLVNYVLQATPKLQATSQWATASGVPARIGDRMFLTNSVPQTGSFRVYRLRSP